MIWLILLALGIAASLYLTAPLLPAKTQQQKLNISLFMALFIGASLGTYALIGTPKPPHIEGQNIIDALPQRVQTPQGQNTQNQSQQTQVTQEQINAMVNGLAARLAENPEDPEGWTRLLRSRIVLADMANLIQDHKTMSEIYKTRPEIITQISEDSGFNNFAARIIEQQ